MIKYDITMPQVNNLIDWYNSSTDSELYNVERTDTDFTLNGQTVEMADNGKCFISAGENGIISIWEIIKDE